jgi:hypothetical protein
MKRAEFTKNLMALGLCPHLICNPGLSAGNRKDLKDKFSADQASDEPTFIENWLMDLLDSMEKTIDRETQVKIIEGCGRGCFIRHQFKRDIAEKGKGNLDNLIKAYAQNYEIWRDGDEVHIRYGEISSRCYCPVVQNIPAKPGDLHCECTRSTHQAMFETALGRPMHVEIVESLRRGGKTCHFRVDVSA